MPDVKTIYRLNDLEVQEVSLVDKPANQRKFILVKAKAPEVEESAAVEKDGVDDAMADRATEATELLVDLHPEIQKKLAAQLELIGNRALALAQSVAAAKPLDKADLSVPERLLAEVGSIHAAIGSILPEPTQKAPPPPMDEEQPAEGAPAEDEAAPPANGKKKPPKPGASAKKVDALVASIEKLSGLDGEAMWLLGQAAAREAITCASDAMWRKDWDEATKYTKVAFMLLAQYAPATSDVEYANRMTEAAKALAVDVEKAGRKMSANRMAELDKTIRALLEMAEECSPGYKAGLFLAKADQSPDQTATIEALINLIESKDAQIKTLKGGARPAPNVGSPGDSHNGAKRFSWPLDMNADYLDNPDELNFD